MMTGYGYNANLVQPPALQGATDEWGQGVDQASFFPGIGNTSLTNPLYYGSLGSWYNAPCYGYADSTSTSSNHTQAQALQQQQPTHSFHLLQNPSLAPPQPRVSISDEELYQALNMSPHPTSSTSGYHLQQQQNPQTTEYLTSENCYPSSSSYDSAAYQAAVSKLYSDNAHHHDGDDERSDDGGEPGRSDAMSPTFSIHSFAQTASTNTAEAEDLEVELINHLKPEPIYLAHDDIDIFLHTGTTDDTEYRDDSSRRTTTTYSHQSTNPPSQAPSRPAYAQKLTAAHQPKPETGLIIPDVSAPLFLQTAQDPAGFTPLLTPNTEALLHKKLSENQTARDGPTFPAFPPQTNQSTSYLDNYPLSSPSPSYLEKSQPFEQQPTRQGGFYKPNDLENFEGYLYRPAQSGQDLLPLLFDSFKPLLPAPVNNAPTAVPVNVPELLQSTKKEPKQRDQPAAPVKSVRLSDQELESQSQALAIDVISNLFTSKKEIIDRAAVLNRPKKPVNRNLFCHDEESLRKAQSDEPINMSLLDDWETADTDDLAGRMETLMRDAKKEEKKKPQPPKPTFSVQPKNSDWDSNVLPHVLEIYGVPDYKMQEDVVKAMETIGYGDCRIQWHERKIVLAVFENVARAKNCQTMAKHEWLRFRPLTDSPKTVQDYAKSNVSTLSIPTKKQQTNASVARRLVEGALGKKANISPEKRQEERNQLAAARAAKKNAVKWD